jgi:hypothetical protein
MRFVVQVRANPTTEAGVLPTAEQFRAMMRFNEELIQAGIMLAGDGLQPSSKGARIAFQGGHATVTDGPFAETKELIAGFWIVQAKSKEEVVERFKHAPMEDGDVLEVRQIYEADDFGDNFPPEFRERGDRVQEGQV